MNRAILALFMTLALVNAFTYKGNGFTSDGLFEFVDTTCNGAISGFNKGIQKLISNIQTKSNEWLVYSDLDTLDGYAYHLQNLCDPEDYELTTQLQGGQTPEQQQACSNLLALLGSILDQNQPQAFKSGYEQGLALSNQALTFGPNIVKGCKISIVVNADDEESSAEEEEELGLNGENGEEAGVSDDSDAPVLLAAKLNLLAQKESDEDSSDDSSDEGNEEEWAGEEWNDKDPLAITKAWDIAQVADKIAKIAEKIAQIAENNEEAGVSDDSDALDMIFAANLNVFAQKEADEDSSDDSSDESNEEEWNNEDSLATTKAWNIGTVADKIAKIAKKISELAENNEEEESLVLATTKAWDSEKVADKIAKIAKKIAKLAENNEEAALTGWDNGDWSDFSHFGSNDEQYDLSDAPKSTFFYEVNPNGNTDSGSDWLNGGYNRYIPGGSGAPTGNTGNAGTPSIPSIPGIGGNGGSKVTFLAAIGQQASGNPWASGDYKRYYSGDSGNGGAPATNTFLAFKQDKEPEDFYWTI